MTAPVASIMNDLCERLNAASRLEVGIKPAQVFRLDESCASQDHIHHEES